VEIQKIISPFKSIKSPRNQDETQKEDDSQQMRAILEQKIEYKKLKDFIDLNHPTKVNDEKGVQVPFGLCERLGRLHVFSCG